MTVLVIVAFLILTFAIVVLFAMVGELASRVPDPAPAADAAPGRLVPLAGYKIGAPAGDWPGALAVMNGNRRAVLLVLSPACASCNRIAAELASVMPTEATGLLDVGVVVSSSTSAAGQEFVDKYALGRVPHVIDERGEWVIENFGIRASPAALVFDDQVLGEAYTFSKLQPLRDHVLSAAKGVT